MGQNSKIQWADHTFNAWRGCTKVLGVWGDDGTRVVAAEAAWKQPIKWDREAKAEGVRRRVFTNSLADVLEDRKELIKPRERLFHLINETPNLDWLLVTKRPDNFRRMLPDRWTDIRRPDNVWLGVTAENQEQADKRIPILLGIPAKVRFVSCEPMLGPINFSKWMSGLDISRDENGLDLGSASGGSDLDWIIFGGESGPNARPCNIEWIRDGVRQCKQAGVKAFVKQLGARAVLGPNDAAYRVERNKNGRETAVASIADPKGGNPDEWPEYLRVREVPT